MATFDGNAGAGTAHLGVPTEDDATGAADYCPVEPMRDQYPLGRLVPSAAVTAIIAFPIFFWDELPEEKKQYATHRSANGSLADFCTNTSAGRAAAQLLPVLLGANSLSSIGTMNVTLTTGPAQADQSVRMVKTIKDTYHIRRGACDGVWQRRMTVNQRVRPNLSWGVGPLSNTFVPAQWARTAMVLYLKDDTAAAAVCMQREGGLRYFRKQKARALKREAAVEKETGVEAAPDSNLGMLRMLENIDHALREGVRPLATPVELMGAYCDKMNPESESARRRARARQRYEEYMAQSEPLAQELNDLRAQVRDREGEVDAAAAADMQARIRRLSAELNDVLLKQHRAEAEASHCPMAVPTSEESNSEQRKFTLAIVPHRVGRIDPETGKVRLAVVGAMVLMLRHDPCCRPSAAVKLIIEASNAEHARQCGSNQAMASMVDSGHRGKVPNPIAPLCETDTQKRYEIQQEGIAYTNLGAIEQPRRRHPVRDMTEGKFFELCCKFLNPATGGMLANYLRTGNLGVDELVEETASAMQAGESDGSNGPNLRSFSNLAPHVSRSARSRREVGPGAGLLEELRDSDAARAEHNPALGVRRGLDDGSEITKVENLFTIKNAIDRANFVLRDMDADGPPPTLEKAIEEWKLNPASRQVRNDRLSPWTNVALSESFYFPPEVMDSLTPVGFEPSNSPGAPDYEEQRLAASRKASRNMFGHVVASFALTVSVLLGPHFHIIPQHLSFMRRGGFLGVADHALPWARPYKWIPSADGLSLRRVLLSDYLERLRADADEPVEGSAVWMRRIVSSARELAAQMGVDMPEAGGDEEVEACRAMDEDHPNPLVQRMRKLMRFVRKSNSSKSLGAGLRRAKADKSNALNDPVLMLGATNDATAMTLALSSLGDSLQRCDDGTLPAAAAAAPEARGGRAGAMDPRDADLYRPGSGDDELDEEEETLFGFGAGLGLGNDDSASEDDSLDALAPFPGDNEPTSASRRRPRPPSGVPPELSRFGAHGLGGDRASERRTRRRTHESSGEQHVLEGTRLHRPITDDELVYCAGMDREVVVAMSPEQRQRAEHEWVVRVLVWAGVLPKRDSPDEPCWIDADIPDPEQHVRALPHSWNLDETEDELVERLCAFVDPGDARQMFMQVLYHWRTPQGHCFVPPSEFISRFNAYQTNGIQTEFEPLCTAESPSCPAIRLRHEWRDRQRAENADRRVPIPADLVQTDPSMRNPVCWAIHSTIKTIHDVLGCTGAPDQLMQLFLVINQSSRVVRYGLPWHVHYIGLPGIGKTRLMEVVRKMLPWSVQRVGTSSDKAKFGPGVNALMRVLAWYDEVNPDEGEASTEKTLAGGSDAVHSTRQNVVLPDGSSVWVAIDVVARDKRSRVMLMNRPMANDALRSRFAQMIKRSTTVESQDIQEKVIAQRDDDPMVKRAMQAVGHRWRYIDYIVSVYWRLVDARLVPQPNLLVSRKLTMMVQRSMAEHGIHFTSENREIVRLNLMLSAMAVWRAAHMFLVPGSDVYHLPLTAANIAKIGQYAYVDHAMYAFGLGLQLRTLLSVDASDIAVELLRKAVARATTGRLDASQMQALQVVVPSLPSALHFWLLLNSGCHAVAKENVRSSLYKSPLRREYRQAAGPLMDHAVLAPRRSAEEQHAEMEQRLASSSEHAARELFGRAHGGTGQSVSAGERQQQRRFGANVGLPFNVQPTGRAAPAATLSGGGGATTTATTNPSSTATVWRGGAMAPGVSIPGQGPAGQQAEEGSTDAARSQAATDSILHRALAAQAMLFPDAGQRNQGELAEGGDGARTLPVYDFNYAPLSRACDIDMLTKDLSRSIKGYPDGVLRRQLMELTRVEVWVPQCKMSGDDYAELERATQDLAQRLGRAPGVDDIDALLRIRVENFNFMPRVGEQQLGREFNNPAQARMLRCQRLPVLKIDPNSGAYVLVLGMVDHKMTALRAALGACVRSGWAPGKMVVGQQLGMTPEFWTWNVDMMKSTQAGLARMCTTMRSDQSSRSRLEEYIRDQFGAAATEETARFERDHAPSAAAGAGDGEAAGAPDPVAEPEPTDQDMADAMAAINVLSNKDLYAVGASDMSRDEAEISARALAKSSWTLFRQLNLAHGVDGDQDEPAAVNSVDVEQVLKRACRSATGRVRPMAEHELGDVEGAFECLGDNGRMVASRYRRAAGLGDYKTMAKLVRRAQRAQQTEAKAGVFVALAKAMAMVGGDQQPEEHEGERGRRADAAKGKGEADEDVTTEPPTVHGQKLSPTELRGPAGQPYTWEHAAAVAAYIENGFRGTGPKTPRTVYRQYVEAMRDTPEAAKRAKDMAESYPDDPVARYCDRMAQTNATSSDPVLSRGLAAARARRQESMARSIERHMRAMGERVRQTLMQDANFADAPIEVQESVFAQHMDELRQNLRQRMGSMSEEGAMLVKVYRDARMMDQFESTATGFGQ